MSMNAFDRVALDRYLTQGPPEPDETFIRPFESSYLNGIAIYDYDFPVEECKNDMERKGWWTACNAEAESDYTDQPGYPTPSIQ
jgi:hypothetical protein